MATVKADFYVSPSGRDAWSGTCPEPLPDASDGPFATLARAQKAARKLRAAADRPVTVLVRGGDYPLSKPITFTRADSGTAEAPVTYAAYGDERPVFSGGRAIGGRAIGGWTEGKDGLWTADIPDVKAGQWAFNQLFVNGRRAIRARHPNEGYLRTAGLPPGVDDPHAQPRNKATCGVMSFHPGDLKRFRNLEDVNIMLYHAWTASLHWIDKLDLGRHTATFTARAGWPLGTWEPEQRYVIENCLEALDMPGEWYLDRKQGRLYLSSGAIRPRSSTFSTSTCAACPFSMPTGTSATGARRTARRPSGSAALSGAGGCSTARSRGARSPTWASMPSGWNRAAGTTSSAAANSTTWAAGA
jgi:hypothetical protein